MRIASQNNRHDLQPALVGDQCARSAVLRYHVSESMMYVADADLAYMRRWLPSPDHGASSFGGSAVTETGDSSDLA
jgi:hypothetical protein